MIPDLAYYVAWGFSVRYPLLVAGLCGGLIAGSQARGAPKEPIVRNVQLISMTESPPTQDPTLAREAPPSNSLKAALPLPEAFQVHDLSRRYVQFRMQQELTAAFTGPGEAPDLGSKPVSVAAFSSIQVPNWLRAGVALPADSFKPGCTPLAYRPSGFLTRSAEMRRSAYYGMMSAVACEHGIPTGLFDAMIIRESGYNPLATSTADAYGLAQLMPGTAVGLGVDRYDPLQNMRGGARYLRQQLDRFGQVNLALAAYNAGPGRIKARLVPRISETQAYVSDIITNWSRLTTTPGSSALPTATPRSGFRYVTYTRY